MKCNEENLTEIFAHYLKAEKLIVQGDFVGASVEVFKIKLLAKDKDEEILMRDALDETAREPARASAIAGRVWESIRNERRG